jgi:EAL domain-containing protein (putative c-di-GMP-specific phosphodiesterase class I)
MTNNILPFASSTAVGTTGCREAADIPATVIDLFRVPCQARKEAAANQNALSEVALTPADVWSAICDERVCVHYQPQYEIRSGRIVAAEALVRLIDTEGQLIFPDPFIGLAEQSDLIALLGRAVIQQVCADMATYRKEGGVLERVAINLSAHQLNVDTQLSDFVDEALVAHGLQHSDLEFELTERQKLKPDDDGMAVLRTLAARGARIVIDDFGMGYSSLAYLTLTDLPISAIKLDRAMVGRLPDDQTMQLVVNNLLTLVTELGLEVVAEGVETAAQNEYLAGVGCPYAQGFGYARPMGIRDLRDFIADDSGRNNGSLYSERSLNTESALAIRV